MNDKIDLVATDLDGTLLDPLKNVPSDFEDFVLSHKDINFVIASGRQYYNILDLFPKCRDELIFIAENGGLVYRNGQVLHKDTMSREDVDECLKIFSDPEICSLILCGVKSAYMLKSASKDCYDNSYLYYKRLDLVDSFEDIDDDILKIAIFVEGYRANEYYHEITAPNDRLECLLSGNCWIDVSNKTVSKGAAMRRIMEITGSSFETSMAFGDYLNDESLIRSCKFSYAMANAHPDLKKLALREAPSNEDNGVMRVLYDVFDKEPE